MFINNLYIQINNYFAIKAIYLSCFFLNKMFFFFRIALVLVKFFVFLFDCNFLINKTIFLLSLNCYKPKFFYFKVLQKNFKFLLPKCSSIKLQKAVLRAYSSPTIC